jgi:predicted Fe-S protein YdhL (DUF1289 family)
MSDIEAAPKSPCVRDCCLDDDLVCLGCFRSFEEIKDWSIVDDAGRRLILKNANRRREASRSSASPPGS